MNTSIHESCIHQNDVIILTKCNKSNKCIPDNIFKRPVNNDSPAKCSLLGFVTDN